jgi:HK97 family phage portal protein
MSEKGMAIGHAFCFLRFVFANCFQRTVRVKVGEQIREMWRQATHGTQARHAKQAGIGAQARTVELEAEAERRTLALPAILSPLQFPGKHLPKPTPANLRRFAETPVVRRAINVIKDRIAAMDWQIRVRRGVRPDEVAFAGRKLRALRRTLEEPNPADSFRTLVEQAMEDALTGGFGAIEMEPAGDPERPAMLWPVDGASIRINARWDGSEDTPRYAQAMPGQLESGAVELLDRQLMYIRMNPRSFTPFGLGPLEVAFETVNQFLSANRFAGKLAANSVAQYALWLNEATPVQHDRLIRWWQDEIEGTGRVPLISTEQKPEVLRFAQGTDADLRLQWQEFLIRMVANAFGLPPLMLGLEADVNQSTASEMADEAFRGAISPLAMLVAGHITRDLFAKCIGWREFEFVFNELSARDEGTELQVQVQLLQAGVLTIDEVRAMRGLAPLGQNSATLLSGEAENRD